MARYSEDVIERLKAEVSLERLVRDSGVELRKHGVADLIGRCPFHADKTPSLVVTPGKNLWHCLGACQTGGSVIDWMMKSERVSFRHAVELLRGDLFGAAASPTSSPASPSRRAALPSLVEATAEDREVLGQVMAYYRETLKQSPEALAYLKEDRGLGHPELIDHFQLGYANRTLGYRLTGAQRERLQRLGVLRESGHEHLSGSLIVPILGEAGEVVGMYGRKITPASKLRKGTPLHLYLPGPHRGVFNVAGVRASRTVILCESLLDALSFWNAGLRNVTSSFGAGGFTAELLEAFQLYGTEQVAIAYDRDEAGDRAVTDLSEKLLREGIECFRVQFPKGMDANEYARRVTPAGKGLSLLLRHAVWLGRGPAKLLRGELDVASIVPELGAAEAEAGEGAAAAASVAETPGAVSAAQEAQRDNGAPDAVPHEREDVTAPGAAPALAGASVAQAPPSLAAKEGASSSSRPGSPEARGDELSLGFGDRRYRVRGLSKNLAHGALKVNLLVARGEALHVDTLDLCSARQRAAFVKQAAAELRAEEDTIKRDVGQVLLRLEQVQDELIAKTLEPKSKEVTLSEAEQQAALELLRDPHLLDRILADFEACGVVGEQTNKLLGYLAVVSRLLEEPLAIIVQSSSAAGKTALMEGELAFVPEEAKVKYSAMTGQSLFYMGESDLKHKVLAIVEEAGAERAAYALKLLQSEGELTIASTGKDPASGRLVTHEYRVEGPVMIFLTTTAVEIDEELLNRCLVLTVDEDREQTRAIHRRQRERQTLEGLLARQARPGIVKVHQDAQRLLKPLLVANPYAPRLTFLDDRTRTRRDHVKYLTLIRAITLLHQYQREVKTTAWRGAVVPYIEVTLGDIAVANRLAHQVLGRSLDELAPQTRRLLLALDAMASEACAAQQVERSEYRFTRKQVRARLGWSQTQVRVHLDRLVELEHVTAHHGKQGQGYLYELVYDGQGQDGEPFLVGLIDVATLAGTTETSRGETAHFAGRSRADDGPLTVGWRGGSEPRSPAPVAAESISDASERENACLGTSTHGRPVVADAAAVGGNGRYTSTSL